MIHARIGTAGSRDKANVHPYRVDKDILMMHNGIVSIGSLNTSKSDTWHVARAIAKFRNPSNVLNASSHEYNLIDTVCGSSSKFIFLDINNRYCIMNASAGHYDKEGNWYSNHNYKQTEYYDVGGKKVRKGKANNYSYNDYDWDSYKTYPPVVHTVESSYNDLVKEIGIALGKPYAYTIADIERLDKSLQEEYAAANCYELAVWFVEYNLVPMSDVYYIEQAMEQYERLYEKKYKVVPSAYYSEEFDIDAGMTEEDDV